MITVRRPRVTRFGTTRTAERVMAWLVSMPESRETYGMICIQISSISDESLPGMACWCASIAMKYTMVAIESAYRSRKITVQGILNFLIVSLIATIYLLVVVTENPSML